MRSRSSSPYLRWGSLIFVLLAAILTVFQLVQYSLLRADYPADMTVGGVPVGGLDPQAAAQRLLEVYATPVEIQYEGAVIDLDPALVGFQVDVESMLAEADLQRTGAPFWTGFWDYLWNRRAQARQTPLVSTYSEDRLRAYLQNEVSARYDQPPTPAQPVPGTSSFTPGTPGQVLDIDRAVVLIEAALRSPDQRVVVLSSQRTAAARPSIQTLEILLKQIIDESGFDGLTDLYFRDLQTSESIHFAYENGQDYPVTPSDISFTASSTIKIPIMVSLFRQTNSQINSDMDALIKDMIQHSNNSAADTLMHMIDEARGPLVVTETMKDLGLENTYIAAFFCTPVSPCASLDHFSTPANQRVDINTSPDVASQTTPADMGMLLEDLYLCAENGGGSLIAAFGGQITQAGCQQMIQYLQSDILLGALIRGGIPEGTVLADKYGYVSDTNTGVLYDISDAGIVYTPGGNYVLTIYVHHPVQALWDIVNPMDEELSRAIYNYFNLPSQ